MWRWALIIGITVIVVFSVSLAFSQDAAKTEKKLNLPETIDRLGSDDFAARKKAAEALLAYGEEAIPALREAMKSHEDTHVKFECAKILRKIEAAKAKKEQPLAEKEEYVRRANRQVEEMLRRFEKQGLLGEEELERFRKMFEAGESAQKGFASSGVMQGTVVTGDRQVQYRRNADGSVKVTITEKGETKSYEAKSLDELKEKAPEVHAEVVKHFGKVRVFTRADPFDFDFPKLEIPRVGRLRLRESPFAERPGTDDPPGGFRLGIWVGEVSEALRTHLKLEKNEGVLVEAVVKGSLGDTMGLRRLDVVKKLNGVRIASAPEIRRELEKVAEGGKVTLEIIRKGDPLTLVGTR